MTLTIRKGKHRAMPLRFGFFVYPKAIRRAVTFHEDCRYFIKGEDAEDINKLFGLGFIPGLHHRESARFGWRYDLGNRKILLFAYCYINGRREVKELCQVPINQKLILSLHIYKANYYFSVICDGETLASVFVPKFHVKIFAYYLGLYFGGNLPAPQKMTIDIKKI